VLYLVLLHHDGNRSFAASNLIRSTSVSERLYGAEPLRRPSAVTSTACSRSFACIRSARRRLLICFGLSQEHYVAFYDSLTPRFSVAEINDAESLPAARCKLMADHDNAVTGRV
jgi:hypothetical protein